MPWLNGKKVQALWAHETKANSWAWIDGAWRKFHDANPDSCTNFTILGAHAKDGNREGAGRQPSEAMCVAAHFAPPWEPWSIAPWFMPPWCVPPWPMPPAPAPP